MSARALIASTLLLCATCKTETPAEMSPTLPEGSADDLALAKGLLEPAAALPVRAEVVALTDRLAVAADKAAEGAEELRMTAARLRERVWRLDGSATDAREALELYARVVDKTIGDAISCDADLRRARIAGELSGDAMLAYRDLYLATERQEASSKDSSEAESCLAQLREMLSRVEAYRPTGAAWQDLQREGAKLAQPPAPSASASPSGSASTSLASTADGFSGEEIVVKPPASMVAASAVLTDVQPYSAEHGARIVLHLSAPATYETGILKPDASSGKGHRIYLDLAGVKPKGKKHRTIETKGLLERVRMAPRGGGVRVVLDLAEQAFRRVFYLPNPYRVVIDVGTRKEETPHPVAPGKRSVRRVTLDPGHGGWDGGAIGPTGLQEKDVALDVAHRAAPALASELGVETMLTRDTDVYVDLEERTARANAFQSDVFISIHCNATENGEATGHEIYILDPSREGDRRAYAAMARENHARGKALDPSAVDKEVASIAAGLQLGNTTKQSYAFAALLQQSTAGSLATRYPGMHDHGVKTAGFYVLVGAQMPAVLFETAFISNTDDEVRLSTADFRQKLADAIVNAVRAYRDGL